LKIKRPQPAAKNQFEQTTTEPTKGMDGRSNNSPIKQNSKESKVITQRNSTQPPNNQQTNQHFKPMKSTAIP
jgi:hypothetical protein